MLIHNWQEKIDELQDIKNSIYLNDDKYFWTFCRPEYPASEERLRIVEQILGHKLDRRYRMFLRHANGWRGFYLEVDLFGTDELLGGTRMDRAMEIVEAIGGPDGQIEQGHGTRFSETMPIAVDTEGTVILQHKLNGNIYGINGSAFDSYENFDDFFLDIIKLHREFFRNLLDEKL